MLISINNERGKCKFVLHTIIKYVGGEAGVPILVRVVQSMSGCRDVTATLHPPAKHTFPCISEVRNGHSQLRYLPTVCNRFTSRRQELRMAQTLQIGAIKAELNVLIYSKTWDLRAKVGEHALIA